MVTRGELVVAQLYPRDMNIYGDSGNVLALTRRAQAQGFQVRNVAINQGDELPDDVDIILGGGGQDSGQSRVHEDLLLRGERLRSLADDDVPMLMICGLYQLFGHVFRTHSGEEMAGISVLDVKTFATEERLIGNIVTVSGDFGEIIGYENHSGHTFLGDRVQPLGTVVKGEGNNTTDDTEGARYRNVIGSYLHGSLLPKNPAISDFLIHAAAARRYGSCEIYDVPNEVIRRARESARHRPR